jgi:hypothetical protein
MRIVPNSKAHYESYRGLAPFSGGVLIGPSVNYYVFFSYITLTDNLTCAMF